MQGQSLTLQQGRLHPVQHNTGCSCFNCNGTGGRFTRGGGNGNHRFTNSHGGNQAVFHLGHAGIAADPGQGIVGITGRHHRTQLQCLAGKQQAGCGSQRHAGGWHRIGNDIFRADPGSTFLIQNSIPAFDDLYHRDTVISVKLTQRRSTGTGLAAHVQAAAAFYIDRTHKQHRFGNGHRAGGTQAIFRIGCNRNCAGGQAGDHTVFHSGNAAVAGFPQHRGIAGVRVGNGLQCAGSSHRYAQGIGVQAQALGRHIGVYIFLFHIAGVLAVNHLIPAVFFRQNGYRPANGNGYQDLVLGTGAAAQVHAGVHRAHGNDLFPVGQPGHPQGVSAGVAPFCRNRDGNYILAYCQSNASGTGNGGRFRIRQRADGNSMHLVAHDGCITQGIPMEHRIQHRIGHTQALQLIVGISVGRRLGASGLRHISIHRDHKGKGAVQKPHIIIGVIYRHRLAVSCREVLHVLMTVHAARGRHIELFQIQRILALGDIFIGDQPRSAQQGLIRGVPSLFLGFLQAIFDNGGSGAAAGTDIEVVVITLIAGIGSADQRRRSACALLLPHPGRQVVGRHIQFLCNGHKRLRIGHGPLFLNGGKSGQQGIILHKGTLEDQLDAIFGLRIGVKGQLLKLKHIPQISQAVAGIHIICHDLPGSTVVASAVKLGKGAGLPIKRSGGQTFPGGCRGQTHQIVADHRRFAVQHLVPGQPGIKGHKLPGWMRLLQRLQIRTVAFREGFNAFGARLCDSGIGCQCCGAQGHQAQHTQEISAFSPKCLFQISTVLSAIQVSMKQAAYCFCDFGKDLPIVYFIRNPSPRQANKVFLYM